MRLTRSRRLLMTGEPSRVAVDETQIEVDGEKNGCTRRSMSTRSCCWTLMSTAAAGPIPRFERCFDRVGDASSWSIERANTGSGPRMDGNDRGVQLLWAKVCRKCAPSVASIAVPCSLGLFKPGAGGRRWPAAGPAACRPPVDVAVVGRPGREEAGPKRRERSSPDVREQYRIVRRPSARLRTPSYRPNRYT
jgi:hypothetical protein